MRETAPGTQPRTRLSPIGTALSVQDLDAELHSAAVTAPTGFRVLRDNKGVDRARLYTGLRPEGADNFFTFFGLVWNLMLSPFLFALFATREIVLAIFLIPFVLVGVGTLASGWRHRLNRIFITLDEHDLTIRSRPLGLRRETFARGDVEQVFVSERPPPPRPLFRALFPATGHPGFLVQLRTKERTRVLGCTRNEDHALYVEQVLEDLLGITDEAVAGEVSRDRARAPASPRRTLKVPLRLAQSRETTVLAGLIAGFTLPFTLIMPLATLLDGAIAAFFITLPFALPGLAAWNVLLRRWFSRPVFVIEGRDVVIKWRPFPVWRTPRRAFRSLKGVWHRPASGDDAQWLTRGAPADRPAVIWSFYDASPQCIGWAHNDVAALAIATDVEAFLTAPDAR